MRWSGRFVITVSTLLTSGAFGGCTGPTEPDFPPFEVRTLLSQALEGCATAELEVIPGCFRPPLLPPTASSEAGGLLVVRYSDCYPNTAYLEKMRIEAYTAAGSGESGFVHLVLVTEEAPGGGIDTIWRKDRALRVFALPAGEYRVRVDLDQRGGYHLGECQAPAQLIDTVLAVGAG
jgi:hypothetical protein